MKKGIILTIALLASMNAHAKYLFVNITGHLRGGYPIAVKDPNGRSNKPLAVIQSGKSAYVGELKSYEVVAHKASGKKKGRTLSVIPSTDDPKANVMVINVKNLTNRLTVEQMTLEQAEEKHPNRFTLPDDKGAMPRGYARGMGRPQASY